MIQKVLIANRGEIAVRIIRACKALGIETVAIYSTADEKALHRVLADKAVCIGGPSPQSSYLNIPSIIQAALNEGADAIHPGYGFLSESSQFVRACDEAGITFIGPSAKVIDAMGDKAIAKQTMKKAGVPLVPGSDSPLNLEKALKLAEEIKPPVLLKAVAGGGGKGMRRVDDLATFKPNFLAAKSEAENAFNNGDLYLEKYLVNPRHIEVQILADQYGNTVHLGTRDCSVQRNHQKVIEEAPALLPPGLEEKITAAAVKAAKAVNYVNAGTIEFLVTKDDFFFIEMNTRIQVEHPVTEMITGIDLVAMQLWVASGEKLPFTQDDIKFNGHAIEVRLNAEKPNDGFKPSPGPVSFVHFPGGPHVRMDTYLYSGASVVPFYDSMMGKLIVHHESRPQAIATLSSALDELVIEGIDHNQAFLKRLIHAQDFEKGDYHTGLLTAFLSRRAS